MAGFIYSKGSGLNDAMIGKLETPLKMIIEHESDVCEQLYKNQKDLFNVEKSNRFGETLIANSGFDIFSAVEEGAGAPNDSIQETYRKFIEHIQFMKEFTITAQMMEDSNHGVGADAKSRAVNFTRAYHRTITRLMCSALGNGTKSTMTFAGRTVDLTAPDGKPLFYKNHEFSLEKMKKYKQANIFSHKGFSTSGDGVEQMLAVVANKIRNMKDENGDPIGYVADTVIVPGNTPLFERKVLTACGSERHTGDNHNDINTQFGNWNVVVLPFWTVEPGQNAMMVMSSDANKTLMGNMFYNRVPLNITHWIDHHTGNYVWTGRCRFGIGFGAYKHIALVTDKEADGSAEEITLTT